MFHRETFLCGIVGGCAVCENENRKVKGFLLVPCTQTCCFVSRQQTALRTVPRTALADKAIKSLQ